MIDEIVLIETTILILTVISIMKMEMEIESFMHEYMLKVKKKIIFKKLILINTKSITLFMYFW